MTSLCRWIAQRADPFRLPIELPPLDVCASGMCRVFTDSEDTLHPFNAIFVCDMVSRPDGLISVGRRVVVHEYRTVAAPAYQSGEPGRYGWTGGCEIEGEVIEVRLMERTFVQFVVKSEKATCIRYAYLSVPYDCARLSYGRRIKRWFSRLPHKRQLPALLRSQSTLSFAPTAQESVVYGSTISFPVSCEVDTASEVLRCA
ncbi:hypothetical protein C8Q76DRAFT_804086 [Earliella scabrosa]|nr:hypothetical protein C8Q76DRAFT_804086 [Earliella scabrosa]